jgi:hypothetical protein
VFVCTGPSQSLGTDAGFGTRACARPEDGQRRLRLTPRRQEALGCCGGSHRGRRITLSWAGTVDADGVAGRGAGSPPRLRGPLLGLHRGDHGARSTPASAGTTLDTLTCSPSTPVHPRVGRDHRVGGRDAWSYLGSRPRRRGPLDALDVQLPAGRFTLASAGTTGRGGTRSPSAADHPRVGEGQFVAHITASENAGSPPHRREDASPGRPRFHFIRSRPRRGDHEPNS